MDVNNYAASFICRLCKPPRVGEVLPNFFVDRLELIFFAKVILATAREPAPCHVATAPTRHNPASLTPLPP
jgi:hypothetical protein